MSQVVSRDYYKVLLVGPTGFGKTYSSRNMNPDKTGFINVEDKPLPYKNKYKYHARPTNVASVFAALSDYAKNPDIEVIIFDSFSAFVDMLLAHCRSSKKGFDVWNMYNEEIGKLLTLIKSVKKEVYVTAHYEILNVEGDPQKRVKVKGKEWEGLIEKEFTIVLFADNKFEDEKKPLYYFTMRGQGLSAKCPPDIFGDRDKVDNDLAMIHQEILNFAV